MGQHIHPCCESHLQSWSGLEVQCLTKGGKDADFRENELKVVFLLAPEKKPKPAQLSKVKSLMMVLLLLVI